MFNTTEASKVEMKDWETLFDWVSKEEESISRIPVHGLLNKKSTFTDDQYFGGKGFKLSFTEHGLKALCYKLGFPVLAIQMLKEKDLSSRMLNDLLNQDIVKEKLKNTELVFDENTDDESQGKVCGVVSDSYVGYSNHSFLHDIERIIGKQNLSTTGSFNFKEAYSINTKLHLRLTSTHISGTVTGRGGISEDMTEIGLQFCNSMIGDSAVSIDYFLHRLVCANGLVLPAGKDGAKVIHAGKIENFSKRLNRAYADVLSGLGEKANYVTELSDIEFSPRKLAELGLSKMIFDIIPRSKSTVIEKNRYLFKDFIFKNLNSEDRLTRESLAIEYLPLSFAGCHSKAVFNSDFRDNASMFDLINVFTEHAKEKEIGERVEIQKRAGMLAEWVINNKRKFKNTSTR